MEAEALYDLLEQKVIPEFYARNEQGIPTAWVARMRESMARLTPRFSADRAVREYTEQQYLPAAATFRERAADKGAAGKSIVDWDHTLRGKWNTLRFGYVKVQTSATHHSFEAEVYLNGLDPNAVRVELYADGINGSSPVRQEMTRVRELAGPDRGYGYAAQVPGTRPVSDYTARVIPYCEGVGPTERQLMGLILAHTDRPFGMVASVFDTLHDFSLVCPLGFGEFSSALFVNVCDL